MRLSLGALIAAAFPAIATTKRRRRHLGPKQWIKVKCYDGKTRWQCKRGGN